MTESHLMLLTSCGFIMQMMQILYPPLPLRSQTQVCTLSGLARIYLNMKNILDTSVDADGFQEIIGQCCGHNKNNEHMAAIIADDTAGY